MQYIRYTHLFCLRFHFSHAQLCMYVCLSLNLYVITLSVYHKSYYTDLININYNFEKKLYYAYSWYIILLLRWYNVCVCVCVWVNSCKTFHCVTCVCVCCVCCVFMCVYKRILSFFLTQKRLDISLTFLLIYICI